MSKQTSKETLLQAHNILESIFSFNVNAFPQFQEEIVDAFSRMFPDIKFKFSFSNTATAIRNPKSYSHVYWTQQFFSKEHRKKNGIYYTDYDLADYVVVNLVWNKIDSNANISSYQQQIHKLDRLSDSWKKAFLFQQSFLDPTCGSGEFLVSCFRLKKAIYANYKIRSEDKEWLAICKTIYGNDIEETALSLAKARLFHEVLPQLTNKVSIKELTNILCQNFSNCDMVAGPLLFAKKFDYIIGNPPYIESSKYPNNRLLLTNYGNIYADVIQNSFQLLKHNGSLGFIIPLSYVSTARMLPLRELIQQHSHKQILLNFADRPASLFPGVHQKVNILFAFCGDTKCVTYTSSYKYWYKEERKNVLGQTRLIQGINLGADGFPKIGSSIAKSIFYKIRKSFSSNLFDLQIGEGRPLYLNMRAAFWIKAFPFKPGSSEYKEFTYSDDIYDFIICVLNSSLFWVYWVMISDGWHITQKELKSFTLPPHISDLSVYTVLKESLINKLEETKLYVGTVQTDYVYRHKLCKTVIDQIDATLAKYYNFTKAELKYIQTFALKYRVGENR